MLFLIRAVSDFVSLGESFQRYGDKQHNPFINIEGMPDGYAAKQLRQYGKEQTVDCQASRRVKRNRLA